MQDFSQLNCLKIKKKAVLKWFDYQLFAGQSRLNIRFASSIFGAILRQNNHPSDHFKTAFLEFQGFQISNAHDLNA
jgi:hypothetical protein